MNTYEHFNKKVDERKAAVNSKQQKERYEILAPVLFHVFAALIALCVLWGIGFISREFCMLLTVTVLCLGSFVLGRVWYKIKR